jgi:predicted nucleotidyltransferase
MIHTQAPATDGIVLAMASRILAEFEPELLFLFGSRARGDHRPESDVDWLVVMPITGNKRDTRLAIRRRLRDFQMPLDIVVASPEEFQQRKNLVGTIEWVAAREGKVMDGCA